MADGDIVVTSSRPVRAPTLIPNDPESAYKMATAIAASGLFGCKNADQAFSLMLLADAEGLHPAIAARDYHIIEGRPSLRSDAMLARFQANGGRVKWIERSNQSVTAEFSHEAGGACEVTWTIEMAANVTRWSRKENKYVSLVENDNWKNYPRQMLTARVISEGVRTVFPGVVAGLYSPEEVQDFDDRGAKPQTIDTEFQPVEAAQPAPEAAVAATQPHMPDRLSKPDSMVPYEQLEAGLKETESYEDQVDWYKDNKTEIARLHKDIEGRLMVLMKERADFYRQEAADKASDQMAAQ
ncbi:MAG: hypothetical protein AAGJ50_10635 [Pseudomonadota bacterium]